MPKKILIQAWLYLWSRTLLCPHTILTTIKHPPSRYNHLKMMLTCIWEHKNSAPPPKKPKDPQTQSTTGSSCLYKMLLAQRGIALSLSFCGSGLAIALSLNQPLPAHESES